MPRYVSGLQQHGRGQSLQILAMGELLFMQNYFDVFLYQEVQSNNKKKCYLMNSEGHQCKNPKACEPSDCYHGDVGCANGEKPGTGCLAKMEFNSEPGFIHWGCVKEGVDNLPSPYDQNELTMPAGTICTTAHR